MVDRRTPVLWQRGVTLPFVKVDDLKDNGALDSLYPITTPLAEMYFGVYVAGERLYDLILNELSEEDTFSGGDKPPRNNKHFGILSVGTLLRINEVMERLDGCVGTKKSIFDTEAVSYEVIKRNIKNKSRFRIVLIGL